MTINQVLKASMMLAGIGLACFGGHPGWGVLSMFLALMGPSR